MDSVNRASILARDCISKRFHTRMKTLFTAKPNPNLYTSCQSHYFSNVIYSLSNTSLSTTWHQVICLSSHFLYIPFDCPPLHLCAYEPFLKCSLVLLFTDSSSSSSKPTSNTKFSTIFKERCDLVFLWTTKAFSVYASHLAMFSFYVSDSSPSKDSRLLKQSSLLQKKKKRPCLLSPMPTTGLCIWKMCNVDYNSW